jgi:ATP synthase protein I
VSDPPERRPPDPWRRRPSDESNAAWSIVGTLLSGLLVWGGIGWLLGRWLHVEALFPIGVLVGMGAALYLVFVKYGRSG